MIENLVVFVCEDGENSCSRCKQYNGNVYEEDDSSKPKLPLHPNCRCHYEKYPGNIFDHRKVINFIKNLPEATITALEMKYLPAATGEMIGTAKVISSIYTQKELWVARTRAVIRKSPAAQYKMTEILLELESANSMNDIKKIIKIYNKYK